MFKWIVQFIMRIYWIFAEKQQNRNKNKKTNNRTLSHNLQHVLNEKLACIVVCLIDCSLIRMRCPIVYSFLYIVRDLLEVQSPY